MKTYPIAFSTEMRQAILDGRKTQTRRVVKHKDVFDVTNVLGSPDETIREIKNAPLELSKEDMFDIQDDLIQDCRYGQVGDVLWVREEHLITFSDDRKWITVEFKDATVFRYYYKDLSLSLLKRLYKRKTIGKWQRARFLPKELARIFLERTNTRVERLQDISEEDAVVEGVLLHEKGELYLNYIDQRYNTTQFIYNCRSAKQSFSTLWYLINGDRRDDPKSWLSNPWVWVIEFKRIDKPENF